MRMFVLLILTGCLLLSALLGVGVSPAAAQTTVPEQDAPPVPGILIVGYQKSIIPRLMDLPQEAGMAAVGQELQALNALNTVKISVPEGQEEAIRQELLKNPDVRYVERDYRVEAQLIPNDPRWSQQYGQPAVNAPDAWDITTGSSTVTLAVIDSGIYANHPEFSGRLVRGYDFIDSDGTPQDDCGHGTHVAGIAAATGNNRTGVAGINWRVKIMPIRVISDTGGSCSGPTSGLASGIIYAVEHGAQVINMSVGFPAAPVSQLMADAVQYAYDRGVTLFAAAGNNSGAELLQPASLPHVMAVGATNRALTDRAWFSNRSSQLDHMFVAAPGMDILSTTPAGSFLYEDFGTERNYGLMSGTSMATPFVAGAATLLAGLPQFDTPDKIYQAIYQTAQDIGPTPGWDANTGYGLLQIDLALGYEDFIPTPVEEPDVEYDWVSSEDCPAVVFEWQDIADDGDPAFIGADGRTTLSIGSGLTAPLLYAGQSFDSITISANGNVFFDAVVMGYSDKSNYPIPWPAAPNYLVAPLWADLTNSVGGIIYYLDSGSQFIVQWDQVSFQGPGSPGRLTFQVIFYRSSGNILFQYLTLNGRGTDGSRGTVGLEYGPGFGTQYAYNQAGKLSEGLALLFIPAEPGSTRQIFDCLFVTQSEFGGCDQLPPFGVDLQSDSGDIPVGTQLSIRRLQSMPAHWPATFKPMNRWAEIEVSPGLIGGLVCYDYTAEDVLRAGGRPQNMFLASNQTGTRGWERLQTLVEPEEGQLIGNAEHFSIFGVFALQPVSLPETGTDRSGQLGWAWVALLPLALAAFAAVTSGKRR